MKPSIHPSDHALTRADHPAYRIAGSGESASYAELEQRSNRIAHWARSQGLQHGDHVALILDNSAAFFPIVWAAQRSGLYYTLISTRLTTAEMAYIVGDCGAKCVIASSAVGDQAAGLPAVVPSHVGFFSVGGAIAGFQPLEDATNSQPGTPIPDEVSGSIMLYSSGTTGRPKGIKFPLSHDPIGTITDVTDQIRRGYQFDTETRFLSTAPLYHAAPIYFNLLAMRVGGTAIVMEKFDAEGFLQLVEKHRITHAQMVPTMFVRLLKLPEAVRAKYDLSSLRYAIHGAGPCSVHVKQQMIDWWGPILYDYYGGTEAVGMVSIDSHEWLAHRGSIGRPPEGSIAIVADDGRMLGANEVGDVYFTRGRRFEYHNDPAKTRAAHDARGWSTLGDMGYMDEDGYLYLTDRRADLIISGGVNIYPQEIEDLLHRHPLVSDAAVFGVPNEEFGEEVKAVVQPVDMAQAGPELADTLTKWCSDHLASHKRPRSIDFEAQLPRHETGKLYKRLLRDRYWQGRGNKLV